MPTKFIHAGGSEHRWVPSNGNEHRCSATNTGMAFMPEYMAVSMAQDAAMDTAMAAFKPCPEPNGVPCR
jgi:hypothetical protein